MQVDDRAILMVDDDLEDRSLLQDTFEQLNLGNRIGFAENGEDAIRYLKNCEEQQKLPRLIVLDLNMPKLNGRQTLEMIKSTPGWEGITVVIYSTSLNPKERDECLAKGAHSFVIKPITYQQSLDTARLFFDLSQSVFG
ncbi:two-component system, unclassified family, response regulator [Cnuella takakiae]|uniref:Two-component system, unclassified family, response regulator n=1 Tax=Cnuella takakiae TaxID=1302690 RepID=A0A1M5A8M3_9BACT|nr:response regulator [Cnuella takakiae]OLY92057.1 hypothetical protein BUE76_09235 [Cnuella takakiae]SHF26487.1 two-component system, unclassified family, response regulator [Cnuella takakiae]